MGPKWAPGPVQTLRGTVRSVVLVDIPTPYALTRLHGPLKPVIQWVPGYFPGCEIVRSNTFDAAVRKG